MILSKSQQQITAFVFGVVFIVVILIIAILLPNPTDFQYTTFRIVLALAAAGAAAMIPGFINVEVGSAIRAGGAIAVFVVVYFFSPAKLIVTPKTEPEQKSGAVDVDISPFENNLVSFSDGGVDASPLEVNRSKQEQGRPQFSRIQNDQNRDISIEDNYPEESYRRSSDTTLKYTYDRIGNVLLIKPEMPYLKSMLAGELVKSINAYDWQFPKLSVKVLNNTKETLLLTEVAIKVNSSKINKEPILEIYSPYYDNQGKFFIHNEGW